MKALTLAVLIGVLAFAGRPAALRAQDDRWQITLHSDTTLWDLELERLSGDTLLVKEIAGEREVRVPVMQIDELRLVQAAIGRAGALDARAVEGGLMGSGDFVFTFTLRDRDERLAIIREILTLRDRSGS